MCGIVAGVAERNVVPILLEGLRRLEYRGYDSAGLAVVDEGVIKRCRAQGKVAGLVDKVEAQGDIHGTIGIAHTRWATHGVPSEANAHPHMSNDKIVVVHNGIIENYLDIKNHLQAKGYVFTSDTDTEVIAHLIYDFYKDNHDLLAASQLAVAELKGAYAIAVCANDKADEMVAVRHGSPLIVGVGIGEMFLASDAFALLPVTRRFIYLQEDDWVVVHKDEVRIIDGSGNGVERKIVESDQDADITGKGGYKHFMQKEMFEQPSVIAETMEGRMHHGKLQQSSFDPALLEVLKQVKEVDIIACGTSYHAGMVIKFHLEKAGIRTNVEYASEYLYRDVAVGDRTLFISISQSGETADTLAALEKAKKMPYLGYVGICNVPDSALVRASQFALLTRAGREIGVASTKAFVTQLVVLHLLTMQLKLVQGKTVDEADLQAFTRLPSISERMLELNGQIELIAESLRHATGCLFLGRGESYAIAAEGALKLKELAYIHAEAHPTGELKHGPLALVDEHIPVVAIVTHGALAEKVMSNLQEVQARGGRLIVFADSRVDVRALNDKAVIVNLGELDEITASIASVIPLQLFAYNIALQKGTDVDQPRNLAKSVTVE